MSESKATKLSIPELIAKKRDGEQLSEVDIDHFVNAVVTKEIQDSQLGAMLMAIVLRGMEQQEIVHLTRSMMHSGDVMEWPDKWRGLMVDKHSTGGVGDKVSLPLAPALAACGVKVPMISGRGLGNTGGTLDKLESIQGFNVSQSSDSMRDMLEDVGFCIVGQTKTLVPADRIMYATRDVTGTAESPSLIASSIVSKKAAENLSALVLDVKCGKGAPFKTMPEAQKVAHIMVNIGNGLGIKTRAVITDMNNPLGKTVGNALEVIEAMDCLHGKGPKSLRHVVVTLGGYLLHSADKVASPEAGAQKIAEMLDNGQALDKWCGMLQRQGVTPTLAKQLCADNPDYSQLLPTAKHTRAVQASEAGYVSAIDAMTCAKICKNLGAGRMYATQEVDLAVGLQLHVEVGDQLKAGDTWATVHYNKDLPVSYIADLQEALSVQRTPVDNLKHLIKEVI